jgi:anti-sigma regulatory factor (Ser/Thr protein kinase)
VAHPDVRTVVLAPEPASVRTCRHWIEDEMGTTDPEVLDRLLLCASELVTNAVEHAGTAADVRLAVEDERVRIEVDDRSEALPAVQQPGPLSERGRGMLIIDSCSDRWGVERHPGGKTVWCELALSDGR